MVGFITEMLYNCSFTLHTSSSQRSKLKRLKNGVLQCSVLAPILFNIYIHDIPDTRSKKCNYANDLTILPSDKSWEMIECGLSTDMSTLSKYQKKLHMKLYIAKSLSSAFHLTNREANCILNGMVNNDKLKFQASPT